MYGEKVFGRHIGFPTPEETPEESTCLTLLIPANAAWWGIYTGLLLTLNDEDNWQQYEGGIEREDAAETATAIFLDAMERANGESCELDFPAPYWDDAEDVDDSLPIGAQTWYGEVTDPDAAPDELAFVENAAIWLLSGFIAYSGQIGAAVFFHTIAPRFVLAFKRGDVREIIRIVVDAVDYGTLDTDDFPDDIYEQVIVGEPDLDEHDITLIRMAIP